MTDAYLIEPEPIVDERGFFARTFCAREFEEHRIRFCVVQCNVSFNQRKRTLRGLHYQVKPHEEAKPVRCTAGSAFDVIVDLRAGSPTCGKWTGIELSAANRLMLYIPEHVAHGFQTLEDHTEVFYQMSESYHSECARGVRFNHSAFAIRWPIPDPMVSGRDQGYGPYQD